MSRVFIVEDEALVAFMLEDMLVSLDHEIAASESRLDKGLAFARDGSVDFAVLDVNLNGESSLPIAEILQSRGIPFLFATGYGVAGLEGLFADAPVIPKPYLQADLEKAIDRLMRGTE